MFGGVAVLVRQDDGVGLARAANLNDPSGDHAIRVAALPRHSLIDASTFVFPRVAAVSLAGRDFGGWTIVSHDLDRVTRGHRKKLRPGTGD
jgi:hypothetical protein